MNKRERHAKVSRSLDSHVQRKGATVAHSSSPLRGPFVGGGGTRVLTEVGILRDGGDLVRLSLADGLLPELGHNTGCFMKSVLSSGESFPSPARRFTQGSRAIKREPRD